MPRQQQNLRRSSRLLAKNTTESETTDDSEKQQQNPIVEKITSNKKKKKTAKKGIVLESPPASSLEAEPQSKTFGNYLILSEILKKLRTRDLINCRLVNSSWKETASSILSERKDLKAINIQFNLEDNVFLLNSYQNRELNDFKNIIKNSKNFPCKDFKIEGPLGHPDLQSFLSSCGSQIRKLDFDFCPRCSEPLDKKDSISLLRKLLTEQVVNLNSLILDSFGFEGNDERPTEKLFPSPINLPALKFLQIECDDIGDKGESRWMEELVNAAPNLKSLSRARICDDILKLLVRLNKPYLLTEMNCDEDPINCQQILPQFKLKSLAQNRNKEDYPRAADPKKGDPTTRLLVKILNLNVDTLTNISMEWSDAAVCLPATNVFQHVKKFCLVGLEFRKEAKNWNKIPLQTIFPNLETIRLVGLFDGDTFGTGSRDLEGKDLHTKADFPFVTSEPMTQVKTLEVQHRCHIEWLKLLPKVFPNVVHLELENYWDFPQSGHLFWSFTSLKTMDLGTLLGVENLDSVFTGFSIEKCNTLWEKSEQALRKFLKSGTMNIETEAEIKKLRVRPSIVKLKDLQELRIKVSDTDPPIQAARITWNDATRSTCRWMPKFENEDLMSPVTSVYAFGMMPSLKRVQILLTPNEEAEDPLFHESDGLDRLTELEAALAPMAEHPLVTLYPIQMNN